MFKGIKIILDLNSVIAKKNIELKTSKKLLDLIHKDISKLQKSKEAEKIKIYDSIREIKLREDKLIALKGAEISLEKEKVSILSKIPVISSIFKKKEENVSISYKALYFGHYNHCKLIDVSTPNDFIELDKKEFHNLAENSRDSFVLEGKPLIFIDKNSIVNPKLDLKEKSFVYDFKPEYICNVINNVIDFKLTNPLEEKKGLVELLKKYWWVILIVLALYYFYEQDKTTTTPIIFPFLFSFGKDKIKSWFK